MSGSGGGHGRMVPRHPDGCVTRMVPTGGRHRIRRTVSAGAFDLRLVGGPREERGDRRSRRLRTGRMSGALVLLGDAGIGKTVLIDFATGAADDLQVVRTIGRRGRVDLSVRGLAPPARPLPRRRGRPSADPQRQALEVACGRADGPPADPFLVGLATLSLLAEAATETSAWCASTTPSGWIGSHWPRSPSWRGGSRPKGLVLFAARDGPGDLPALDGLPSMVVGGLDRADALELLREVVDGPSTPPPPIGSSPRPPATPWPRRSGGGAVRPVIDGGHLGPAAPARSPVGSSLPHPGPAPPGGDPGLAPPRRRRTHGRPGRHHGARRRRRASIPTRARPPSGRARPSGD